MNAIRYLIILGAAVIAGCATHPNYTVTIVGGPDSAALGINNHGHTVGRLPASGGTEHAFVNIGAGAVDIGTLGGPNSRAWGINDAGVVVGEAENAPGVRRAFIYTGGMMSDLGTLGGPRAAARAINNDGDIAGFADLPDGSVRAFRLPAGGVMQNLGALPSTVEIYSFGYAINAHQTVAGSSSFGEFSQPEPPIHGFVTKGDRLIDIGTFGGQVSEAFGINDHGKVVGTAETLGFRERNAFIWFKGVQLDIGNLGGGFAEAYDINNRNQVVGLSAGSGVSQGFLWQKGKMVALETLIDPAEGWTITDARAINDNQQIAGTGCRAGVCQAVRLDPVP